MGVQGDWTAHPAEIEFTTVAPLQELDYLPAEAARISQCGSVQPAEVASSGVRQSEQLLKEVEAQQEAFGERQK